MHDKIYQIPVTKQDYRKYSFFPRTINEWNSLPQGSVSCKSVEAFKTSLANSNNLRHVNCFILFLKF